MASKELPYSVVSDKDPGKTSISLGKDGWLSPANCTFPQQIDLRFPRIYMVKRVQIQAHHVFIPKKLDLLVGNGRGLNGIPAPPDTPVQFKKLGEIELKDNSHTYYKGREKRILNVEEVGTRLRIILSHNHANQFNPNNQVGLSNITVFGLVYNPKSVRSNSAPPPTAKDNSEAKKEWVAPDDQLSVDRNSLTEIRTIIRILKFRKIESETEHEYLDAKHMQDLIDKLAEAEEEMSELDEKRRAALKVSDYGKAEVCKMEMKRLRSKAIKALPGVGKYLTLAEKKALHYLDGPADNDKDMKDKDMKDKDKESNRQGVTNDHRLMTGNGNKQTMKNPFRSDLPSDDVAATPVTNDRTCRFCGEHNLEFTPNAIMLHYRKSCPFLSKCRFCERVLETRNLHSHYRNRCPFLRNNTRDCPKCGVPVTEEGMQKHLVPNSTFCNGRKPPVDGEYCPLCAKIVMSKAPGVWRRHLIGPYACSANRRRNKFGLNRVREYTRAPPNQPMRYPYPTQAGQRAPVVQGGRAVPVVQGGRAVPVVQGSRAAPIMQSKEGMNYSDQQNSQETAQISQLNDETNNGNGVQETDSVKKPETSNGNKEPKEGKKGKKGKKRKNKKRKRTDNLDPVLSKLLEGVDASFGLH